MPVNRYETASNPLFNKARKIKLGIEGRLNLYINHCTFSWTSIFRPIHECLFAGTTSSTLAGETLFDRPHLTTFNASPHKLSFTKFMSCTDVFSTVSCFSIPGSDEYTTFSNTSHNAN